LWIYIGDSVYSGILPIALSVLFSTSNDLTGNIFCALLIKNARNVNNKNEGARAGVVNSLKSYWYRL
jgi:hypothetical protein